MRSNCCPMLGSTNRPTFAVHCSHSSMHLSGSRPQHFFCIMKMTNYITVVYSFGMCRCHCHHHCLEIKIKQKINRTRKSRLISRNPKLKFNSTHRLKIHIALVENGALVRDACLLQVNAFSYFSVYFHCPISFSS